MMISSRAPLQACVPLALQRWCTTSLRFLTGAVRMVPPTRRPRAPPFPSGLGPRNSYTPPMPTNLTPHTLIYGFTPAGDPDVSPDGSRLLYTLARTDAESKKSLSQVWVCDIDGTHARQLTSAGERNRGARWSPDGTQIAFVSDRVEASGLFVLPMTGGEARELARHPTGISDLAWSPDASKIAYTAVVDPLNPTGTKLADGAAPPVRVTSRIDYKQDNRGYLNDTR